MTSGGPLRILIADDDAVFAAQSVGGGIGCFSVFEARLAPAQLPSVLFGRRLHRTEGERGTACARAYYLAA